MPFQLIQKFINLKNGLQPLKNNLPFHSIKMGFNPFLKENDINAIPIDSNISSLSKNWASALKK